MKPTRKVAIIHTSMVSVEDLRAAFRDEIPEARLINIIDDSLLDEVKTVGHVTPGIVRRMCAYFSQAEQLGVDLIFNQCSSVGEAADVAKATVSVPVLKVDEAMAEEAVRIGGVIAVVATVASTMGPSCRLVERKALEAGKSVVIKQVLIDGALDVLMTQGKDKHNEMVLARVEEAAKTADVVVLAQGSMVALEPLLSHIDKPVLTSIRRGVRKARGVLGLE